jgi:hypothetical protein
MRFSLMIITACVPTQRSDERTVKQRGMVINMKVPNMTGSSKQLKVAVRPDGGVNLYSTLGEIADNQASDMLNMWYDGNALRLRPGLAKKIEQQYGPIIDVYPKDGRRLLLKRISVGGQVTQEKYGVYIATRNAVLSYDGVVFERVPCIANYNNGVWSYSYTDFNFDRCVILPSGNIENSQQDSSLTTYKAEGDSVYIFGSGYFLTITPEVLYWPFPAGEIHVTADYFVTYKSQYVPTISINAPPAGGGVSNEARNFLTPEGLLDLHCRLGEHDLQALRHRT